MSDNDTLEQESPEEERMRQGTRDNDPSPASSPAPSKGQNEKAVGRVAKETKNSSPGPATPKPKSINPRERLKNMDPRNKLKSMDPRQKLNNAKQQLSSFAKDAAKNAAKQAAKKAALAVASNPVALIVIGVVLFIIFLIVFIMGGTSAADPNAPKLTITKTGPTEAKKGDVLDYQIAITYPGTAQDILITDHLPDGTEFDPSTPPPAHYDSTTRTVSWNIKEIVPPDAKGLISNINQTLPLTLKSTIDNAFLINQAQGNVIGEVTESPQGNNGGGGPPAAGYVPPSPKTNDCGKWDFSKWPNQNPLGNYGDPQCNFSKDNLRKLIEASEPNPEYVDIWYNVIVPVESVGYQPNAFAPPEGVQLSLDAGGAWGLYQMGSSSPAGQPPPASGKNGVYDRGDVNWEVQTPNAIKYNKEVTHCSFRYWQSASSVWGKYSC